MKKIKLLFGIVATALMIQSCEKEIIQVQEMEGYFFTSNPKKTTLESGTDAVLSAINRISENDAVANNDTSYLGYARADSSGKAIISKIKNTDFMLVFNQQEFKKLISNTNIYTEKPKDSVDFSKEFVFVLIHPSKFISGSQFYDDLKAEVEDENTMKIKPNFTEVLYRQNEDPIYNYGENDSQVHLFKVPKSKFQFINIEWQTGEMEKIKIGK